MRNIDIQCQSAIKIIRVNIIAGVNLFFLTARCLPAKLVGKIFEDLVRNIIFCIGVLFGIVCSLNNAWSIHQTFFV